MEYYILNKNDFKFLELNNKIINKLRDFNIEKEDSKIAYTYLLYLLDNAYNIDIDHLEVYYNDFGKPYFKNNMLFFNISHSKEYIALVIDNKECGIDIEFMDEIRDFDLLIKKVLSEEEKEEYKNIENKIDYFYRMWTKKEAYFKRQGTGISLKDLSRNINYNDIKTLILENEREIYYISIA